jgi:membrane protein DedA with SNARE-associated domain
MIMKIFFSIIMAAAFLLVTFFGLGPVMFADGSNSERMATLAVVILIYAVLVAISVIFIKKRRAKAGNYR